MYSKAKHIAAFSLFGLYLSITGPSIVWGDGSYIVASSYALGVPHPTGHPLFSTLGKMATLMPFGNIAFRLNLMSVLFCFISFYLLYALVKETVRISCSQEEGEDFFSFLVPLACALAFSLSPMIFEQASSAETYILNLVLSMLLILAVLKTQIISDQDKDTKRTETMFISSCLIAGIAYGNHTLLVVTLALPLSVYFLARLLPAKRYGALLIGFFFLLIGLSVYIYLPLRASADPFLNHGNPKELSNFLWVTLGKQFTQTNFSLKAFADNLTLANFKFATATSLGTILKNLSYYWFFFALIGVFLLRNRGLIVLFASVFLINLGVTYPPTFAAKLSMEDKGVAGYFLVSLVFFFMLSGVALRTIFTVIQKRVNPKFKNVFIFSLGTVLIAAPMLYSIFGWRYDRSKDYSAFIYGNRLLGSMGYAGMFFSLSDAGAFIPYYMQGCENYRADVTLLHSPMFFNDHGLKLLKEQRAQVFEGFDVKDLEFFEVPQYKSFIEHSASKNMVYFESGKNMVVEGDRIYPNVLTFVYGNLSPGLVFDNVDGAKKLVELLQSEYSEGKDEGTVNFTIPLYNIGNFFQEKRLHEAAIKQYLLTLSLDPFMKEAAVNLLASYGALGLLDKAVYFGEMFKRRFDDPLVYYNYANLLYLAGKNEKATRVIEEASRFGESKMFKDLLARVRKSKR